MDPSEHRPIFKLLGGDLCLDFVNTVDWRLSMHPVELLGTYVDLVVWGVQTGIIDEQQAGGFVAEAERDPKAADRVLARAVAVREAIFRVLAALIAKQAIEPGDLQAINTMVQEAMDHATVVATAGGFAWGWSGTTRLDSMLWPVLRSAADMLTSPELSRVKMCADPDCGWLFVDRSKNGRRSWCSMQDCGNRAKARRFYIRNKARK